MGQMNKNYHIQYSQMLAAFVLVPGYDILIANLPSLFIKSESQ